MLGFMKSEAFTKRLSELRCLKLLLLELQQNVRYLQQPVFVWMARQQEKEAFRHFAFLACIRPREGDSLPAVWSGAMRRYEAQRLMGPEGLELLRALGEGLGKTDKEGQVALCQYCGEQLDVMLEKARQEQHAKCKLYRALGVLSGVGLSILVL